MTPKEADTWLGKLYSAVYRQNQSHKARIDAIGNWIVSGTINALRFHEAAGAVLSEDAGTFLEARGQHSLVWEKDVELGKHVVEGLGEWRDKSSAETIAGVIETKIIDGKKISDIKRDLVRLLKTDSEVSIAIARLAVHLNDRLAKLVQEAEAKDPRKKK
jgi:hypothetical protein